MGRVWAGTRLFALGAAAIAVQAADGGLDRQFTETVRPFVAKYCSGCHGGSSPAGQLDLKSYASYADVVRDYQRWDIVRQRLAAGTMPPKPVPPPPDATRRSVVEWIAAMRTAETHRSAGEPGPVLARRLSNAEYDYTIRDLTGVDMRPAREFPVDPAHRRLLSAPANRFRRLFPGRLAVQTPRGAGQAGGDPRLDGGRREAESEIPAAGL